MRVSVSYFNPDSDFNFSLDRGASTFVNFYFDCDKMTDKKYLRWWGCNKENTL